MEGTPWHVGTLKMSENDSRRSKGRCKYYEPRGKVCMCKSSESNTDLDGRCQSSRNCRAYREGKTNSDVKLEYSHVLINYYADIDHDPLTTPNENYTVSHPETVRLGDYVEIYTSLSNAKKRYKMDGDTKDKKIREFRKKCLGQKIGYRFKYCNAWYKITDIIRRSKVDPK